eukprot:c32964_g1_i1 orf=132-299(+)
MPSIQFVLVCPDTSCDRNVSLQVYNHEEMHSTKHSVKRTEKHWVCIIYLSVHAAL